MKPASTYLKGMKVNRLIRAVHNDIVKCQILTVLISFSIYFLFGL
jgi:hypothetical protein